MQYLNALSRTTRKWGWLRTGLMGAALALMGTARAQVSVTATAGTAGPTSYTTVSQAFAAVNAGTHQGAITVLVTGNTTEPTTPVALLRSTAPSSYSSILLTCSGNVTINSATSPTTNRGIIELLGADNVTIDGDDPLTAGSRNLTVLMAPNTVTGTQCIRLASNSTTGTDGADNVIVRNCNIIGGRNAASSTTSSWGILTSNTASGTGGSYSSLNTLIENNAITRCYTGIGATGVSVTYPNTGLIIRNNVLGSSVSADNIGLRGINITYSAATAGAGSALIQGNEIRGGDYSTTGYSATVAGIEVGAVNAGLVISRNNIHDISQQTSSGYGAIGIYVTSATNVSDLSIRNNFIRDMVASRYSTTLLSVFEAHGIFFSAAATNVSIDHNTIALRVNATTGTVTNYVGSCVGINVAGVTLSSFRNNILVNTQNSVNAYGVYTTAAANLSGAAADNNSFHVPTGKVGYYAAANQTTLADWRTATGKDANSIAALPPFVATNNLHIDVTQVTAALPFFHTGATGTGVTADIDGDTRATPPCIGADEFTLPTCTTVTAGAISGSATKCDGATGTLSLSGSTIGVGVSYQWSYGPVGTPGQNALGTGTTQNVSGIPVGEWEVTCTITCAHCGPCSETTPAFHLSVLPIPSITAGNNGPVCIGQSLQLTGSSDIGTSFSWTGPNGFTSSTQNPQVSATATGPMAGTYTVTSSVNGCSSAPGTTQVVLKPAPSAITITPPAPMICAGGSVELTATGGTMTGNLTLSGTSPATSTVASSPFFRNFENGHKQYVVRKTELDAIGVPANTPLNSLSFVVTALGGTTNWWMRNFSVKLAHTGNSDASTWTTTGLSEVFGPLEYTPTVGNNTLAFHTPFVWNGLDNLVIDICYANDFPTPCTEGGSGFCWGNLPSVMLATAPFSPSTVIYYSDSDGNACSVTTTSASSNLRPVMTFGYNVDTELTWASSPYLNTTTGPVVTATPAETSTFTVSSTYDGCTTSGHVTVSIGSGAAPTATILAGGPTTFCTGGSVLLTAQVADGCPPFTYSWSNGVSEVGTNATFTATNGGAYSVTVTGAGAMSGTSAATTVTVNSLPAVSVSPTTGTSCSAGPVVLTANGASTYAWSPATGLNSTTGTSVTASPTANTTYTVTGTDANGCINTATAAMAAAVAPIISELTATPQAVCDGGSSQLHVAATSELPNMLITEVTLYGFGGYGQSVPYPAYIVTGMDDLVELSNASGVPADISGWTLETYATNSAAVSRTKTFPSGTVVPPHGVVVVHLGTGTDLPANLLFHTGGASNSLSSGGNVGVVLKHGTQVVDAVGLNSGYVFAAGTGVTAADWSGFAPSVSSAAGTIRTASVDNNTGANWTTSSATPNALLQTVGFYNSAYNYTNPHVSAITNFAWTPAGLLNNATIAGPLASGLTGEQVFTVAATNAEGCSATGSITVIAGADLVASINVSDTVDVCVGSSITAQAVVTGGGEPYTYAWTFNGGPVGSTASLTYAPTTDGTLSLNVTDACGNSGTASTGITVVVTSGVSVSPTTALLCGPTASVTVTASGAGNYSWSPAAGLSTTTGSTVVVTPTTDVTYTVSSTDGNGCVSTASVVVSTGVAVEIEALTATPQSVCDGGSSQLHVAANTERAHMLITEVTLYGFGGYGQTTPYPSYIVSGMDDLVELNNASGVPADISGWTLETYATNSAVVARTKTFPAGTVVPAHGVVVIHLGTGTDSPANLLFHTNTSSNSILSGALLGVVLKNSASQVVDAVGLNSGYVFAAGTGVTAADWSGFAPSVSSAAGTIRTASVDSNTGADWTTSSAAPNALLQTVGFYNTAYNYTNPAVSPVSNFSWSPASLLNDPASSDPLASGIHGEQVFSVTVTNVDGCAATGTVTVVGGAELEASITASATAGICSGSTITAQAVVTGGGEPYTYAWTFNGSAIGSSTNISFIPTEDGTLVLTVTDACGNVEESNEAVSLTPSPVVSVSPNAAQICNGEPGAELTANGAVSYVWAPASGLNTTTGVSVTATPLTTTTYTVTGTAANGCTGTALVTVAASAKPTVSAEASASTICEGSTVVLSGVVNANNPAVVYSSEGFETFPPAGYTMSGAGIVSATQNTTYFHGGTAAVRLLGSAASNTGTYSQNFNTNLSGTTAPKLRFSHIAALEGPTTSYDYGYVDYSTDGGSTWTVFPATSYQGSGTLLGTGGVGFSTRSYAAWTSTFIDAAATPGTGPATALWRNEVIDLTPWIGSTQFRVRFRMTSDLSVAYYGWLLDDVRIDQTEATATYAWTSTPSGFSSSVLNPGAVQVNANTTYTLSVTNLNGCTSTDEVSVMIGIGLPPAVSNVDTISCGGFVTSSTVGVPHSQPTVGCPFNGAPSTGGQNWFVFIPTADGAVNLSTCGLASFDTRISVFLGAGCAPLTCVAVADDGPGCANGTTNMVFNAFTGNTYYIMVHGAGNAEGTFQLLMNCGPQCAPAPANDACAGAAAISVQANNGSAVPTVQDNTCATLDAPTSCSGTSLVQGLWYTFNSGSTGVVLVNLEGGLQNGAYTASTLHFALYDGACGGLGAGGPVACVSNAAGSNVVEVTPNTDYKLLVYNAGPGEQGSFAVTITAPAPYDVAIDQIVSPLEGLLCSNSVAPVVIISNQGGNDLTSVTFSYSIGGVPSSYVWTGNIPYLGTQQITLPAIVAPGGAQTLNIQALPTGQTDDDSSDNNASVSVDFGGQAVNVVIRTDANPEMLSWSILDQDYNEVATGSGYSTPNTVVTTNLCLPAPSGSACYMFFLSDGFGDGLCCNNGNGYWELRTTSGGALLRDRFEASIDGFSSPAAVPTNPGYGFAHAFCLPAGPANIATADCGVFSNNLDSRVDCNNIPGVARYQFDFSNPDAGFRRLIAVPRPWVKFNEMVTSPLTAGVIYFARVRADQGVANTFDDDHFGTGCEMAIDPNQTQGCTSLIDNISLPTHSCGVVKTFGGNDRIWAKPVAGATQYRFRFANPNEGFVRTLVTTSYICQLNWVSLPLQNGHTYQVQVESFLAGIWKGYCGNTCLVSILNNAPAMQQADNDATQATSGVLDQQPTLWPNPTADNRVNIAIRNIADQQQHITVDIFDTHGRVVAGYDFRNNGPLFNSILDLPQDVASGIYMVRVRVNETEHNLRLSVR